MLLNQLKKLINVTKNIIRIKENPEYKYYFYD